MIPKTKLQKKVYTLSQALPKISTEQKDWAYKNCLEHVAYRTKTNISCLDCGYVWAGPQIVKTVDCPSCKVKLNVKDSRKKKFDQVQRTMAIVDVIEDFQVIRFFEISSYHRSGEAPRQYAWEVVQQYFMPGGKLTVVARNLSYGNSSFSGDLEVKGSLSNYWSSNKYDLFADKIYPQTSCLPIYSRNGFTNKISNLPLYSFFNSLEVDSKMETLLKSGQYQLLSERMGNKSNMVARFWDSIKICIRQKYTVKDAGTWLDYLELLSFFGKDLRSPKYVCPAALKRQHDRLVVKKRKVEVERSVEKRRREIHEAQIEYEKSKGIFFGLLITDGDLTIKVLESVKEFMEEGDIHKHCVFTNNYYSKPDSLVFSARVDGEPVETIELSLSTMKVVQSRGLRNAASEHNRRIVDLMNKNKHVIEKRIRSLKQSAA